MKKLGPRKGPRPRVVLERGGVALGVVVLAGGQSCLHGVAVEPQVIVADRALAELGAPADEGSPALAVQLGLDRLGEALDREHAGLPALEPLAEHRAHAVGDQDEARRGGRGQAGGQIDRIAGDRIAAVAGAAARHHLAARDADMGADVVAELAAQLGQRRADLERRADRRSGSLPWAKGAPNTAITQSPMCLSTVPP
jgi:hypothetical protein